MAHLDVIMTDKGFSLEVNGEFIPIPIGYMRISEREKFSKFMWNVVEKCKDDNNEGASRC